MLFTLKMNQIEATGDEIFYMVYQYENKKVTYHNLSKIEVYILNLNGDDLLYITIHYVSKFKKYKKPFSISISIVFNYLVIFIIMGIGVI